MQERERERADRESERIRGEGERLGSARQFAMGFRCTVLCKSHSVGLMCFMRECYLPAAAYNGIDLANAALYVLRRARRCRKNLVPIARMLYTRDTFRYE